MHNLLMPIIAISVPSGSHHRAFLQPLRKFFLGRTGWNYIIISPGAPWADQFFPRNEYPRDRFSFFEVDTDKFNIPETKVKLKKLYAEKKPILVLTTTTGRDPVDRPILSAAIETGIKTCTFVESWDNIWKMARQRQEQIIPDHIIVWNQIMKEHLLREFPDIRNERISVSGSPRMDYFKHADMIPTREKLFNYLGLDPKKKLLHLATVELYDQSHVAEQIGKAKRKGELPEDLQLYASMHPGSGKPEMHKPWAEKYGFTLRYSFGRKESSPHDSFNFNPTMDEMYLLTALWKYTDVMVNFSSTAALESILADRPTICALYGKKWDLWNWHRSAVFRDFKEHYKDLTAHGGVRVVKKRHDLIPVINDYLEHPEKDRAARIESCKTIMTTLEGDASEKTMEVIINLVNSKL